MKIKVREITQADNAWIKDVFRERWGDEYIVTLGRVHKPEELTGYIAEANEAKVGLVTFKRKENEIEIISLDSWQEKQGIGTLLLDQVIQYVKKTGIKRVWLISLNDNIAAHKFYTNRGFVHKKRYKNSVEILRKLKPTIPQRGLNNILLTDELEFELNL